MRRRGFTLIEILVVLVIIAVLTTIAVLSIGVLGADSGLDAEGDHYTDVVAAASEQAQLEGRDYGVWFGAGGYQVLVHDELAQVWNPPDDDPLYSLHELPSGVSGELSMEGRIVPQAPSSTGTSDAPVVPQVMLFASGDASPYHLTLKREGLETVWQVDGQPDGTLIVIRAGKQAPDAVAPATATGTPPP
jgi:general secretion pathway protein H